MFSYMLQAQIQNPVIYCSYFFVVVVVLHQNKRLPFAADHEKMFTDLSLVKRCLCWLSLLVSRLHLAQPNQNTNTPLSFGCFPPGSPPFFYLSQSYLLTLQAGLDGLPPHFIFTSFVLLLLHILTLV